jgi:hypothetical protein
VLPRQKLAISREQLVGALDRLSPYFRVGPVLSFPEGKRNNPFLPKPYLPGYMCHWLAENSREQEPMPPTPHEGTLTTAPCSMTQGWLTLVPPEAER